MGSIFKKTVTQPLPPGAERFSRRKVEKRLADGTMHVEYVEEPYARWRDGKGKLRTAPLTTGKDGG